MAAPAPQPESGARPSVLGFLFKALLVLVVLAFLAACAWVSWLNYRHDGHVSFRLFDAAWWRPAWQRSEPVLDSVGQKAHDEIWGDHGLVIEVSQWFAQKGSHAPAPPAATGTGTAAPAPGAAAAPSPERLRLEGILAESESEFSAGLELYRKAAPDADRHPDLGRLRQARQHLLSCQDSLNSTLPAYTRCPDHDVNRLDEEEAMQGYNRRLVQSVDTLLGLPPPG